MPVIWNLSYPTVTEDQKAIFRHHFETLRLDSHVADVTATDSDEIPDMMTVRVTFADGRFRPASQELRYLERRYPNRISHIERDIRIVAQRTASQEVARERLRHLAFELPRVTGVPAAEAVERLREALRSTEPAFDVPGLARAVPAIEGYTEPVKIPAWIKVENLYAHNEEKWIVTLKNVRFGAGSVSIEVLRADKLLTYPLQNFVEEFHPYVRTAWHKTAWDHLLENIDD